MDFNSVLEWIGHYWVSWVCALIAGGVGLFAKHYVKIQKESLENKMKERETQMCGKVICTLEEKIQEVKIKSMEEDKILHQELDKLYGDIDSIGSGILSIQGKQFREYCEDLLAKGHVITLDEYEDFESEYEVYKGLGGNHKGDSLHERVVKKFDAQSAKESSSETQ